MRGSGSRATSGSSRTRATTTTRSASRGRDARTRSTSSIAGTRLRIWYVNFERPLRRTPIGVDTFDEKLDLLVFPDGGREWKDEDELEQAAALGLLDAAAVRAEARARAAEWPFPTGWEDWRPDPAWPVPQLPPAGTWSEGAVRGTGACLKVSG